MKEKEIAKVLDEIIAKYRLVNDSSGQMVVAAFMRFRESLTVAEVAQLEKILMTWLAESVDGTGGHGVAQLWLEKASSEETLLRLNKILRADKWTHYSQQEVLSILLTHSRITEEVDIAIRRRSRLGLSDAPALLGKLLKVNHSHALLFSECLISWWQAAEMVHRDRVAPQLVGPLLSLGSQVSADVMVALQKGNRAIALDFANKLLECLKNPWMTESYGEGRVRDFASQLNAIG